MLIALAIIFTGCEKDIETSDLTLDLTKKATIRAYFYAELDQTALGLEFAPNGTKVMVSIPNSDFNPTATGNYIDSAVVTDGMIEVSVPATNNGVSVSLIPAEFVHEQKQAANQNSSVIKKIYKITAAQTVGSVKPGQVRYHQATYTTTSFDNFEELVSVKFELKANVDENVANEFVPSGTVVTLYTSGWSTTATVSASGRLDANVPKGATVTLRFEALKALVGPPAATKKYRYVTTFFAPNISMPVLQTVDFGNGDLWE